MIDSMTIQEIDPRMDARWDAYVRRHPRGSVYHLGAWAEILARSYGFKPRYLCSIRDDSLAAVLPLFWKKGVVSDPRARSIPVFSYGGPLADDDRLAHDLVQAARDLTDAVSVTINTDDHRMNPPDGYVVDELLPRWMVDVPDDLDALRAGWRKSSSNLFRSLKKADKSGLQFREATSAGDLRSFHRMYVRTMKKHRSLPRSLRQLRLAHELLGDAFKLFMVSHSGRDVAGGVYHVFGDTVELVYNGSDEAALTLRPNHALYWNVMQWAAARGLRQVNLGGAEFDTPLASFKQQWGAQPHVRYRLTHRRGDQGTRTEALVSVGYGAESSENRLTLAAWRLIPAPLLRLGAHVAYRYA